MNKIKFLVQEYEDDELVAETCVIGPDIEDSEKSHNNYLRIAAELLVIAQTEGAQDASTEEDVVNFIVAQEMGEIEPITKENNDE